jgi:hypothetical protein
MNQALFISILLGLSLSASLADTATVSAVVTFKGTSTLHDFEGGAVSQPSAATFNEDASSGTMRVTAQVSLNVLDMTTEHGKRDKNMYMMLNEEEFKLITGSLENAEVPMVGTGTVALRLKIRDVEQDVAATVSEVAHSDGHITCRMVFPVSLKAFNLKAPSVMGLIKVGDTVEVECKIQGTIE